MRPLVIALLLCATALAGCKREDMYTQPKNVTWSDSNAFPQALRMLRPVPGTVARNEPQQSAPQPPAITPVLLARGQNRFDIYCAPCHGRSADGHGMIVQRGFPLPPELFKASLQEASKAQHFYDVITHGHGVMYSFAGQLSPSDRWAVAAYIRALQRSQNTTVASLPTQIQARLKIAAPEQVP
jgi:mono/diheme cytochrome c family protein